MLSFSHNDSTESIISCDSDEAILDLFLPSPKDSYKKYELLDPGSQVAWLFTNYLSQYSKIFLTKFSPEHFLSTKWSMDFLRVTWHTMSNRPKEFSAHEYFLHSEIMQVHKTIVHWLMLSTALLPFFLNTASFWKLRLLFWVLNRGALFSIDQWAIVLCIWMIWEWRKYL